MDFIYHDFNSLTFMRIKQGFIYYTYIVHLTEYFFIPNLVKIREIDSTKIPLIPHV